jgi:hypothetical protein
MPFMSTPESENIKTICPICRRPAGDWFLRIAIEDAAGFRQEAFICANCGVKLRLASEKTRDLQIDPWFHEAFARILRGKEVKEE